MSKSKATPGTLDLSDIESYFHEMESKFMDHVSKFSTWRSYLDNIELHRDDPNYYPNTLLTEFRACVEDLYLEENPFLKRYNPRYPEFDDFATESDRQTETLESSRGGIKVKAEFFNIQPQDIHYPKINVVNSVHSGLHSLAMTAHALTHFNLRENMYI